MTDLADKPAEGLGDERARLIGELAVTRSDAAAWQTQFHLMRADFDTLSARYLKLKIEADRIAKDWDALVTEHGLLSSALVTVRGQRDRLAVELDAIRQQQDAKEQGT